VIQATHEQLIQTEEAKAESWVLQKQWLLHHDSEEIDREWSQSPG
jgi:hypothetical protein